MTDNPTKNRPVTILAKNILSRPMIDNKASSDGYPGDDNFSIGHPASHTLTRPWPEAKDCPNR